MRSLTPAILILGLLLSPRLHADGNAAAREECGTSPELDEWLRDAGEWSAARARQAAAKGLVTAAATLRDDVFVLPADDTNAPFRRPFDLAGRTLVFERQSPTVFAMRNVDLDWAGTQGTRLPLEPGDEPHGVVDLDFDFPFFDRTVRKLYVSGHQGIFLAEPKRSLINQYGDAELAGHRDAVIAPLLSTRASRLTPAPEVYVRRDGASIAITWASPGIYSVRALLFASGEIRFSYESVAPAVSGAAILITSGNEEWRSRRSTIAVAADAAGDERLPPTVAPGSALAGMLDITGVSVDRVDALDLFEVRIRTRAPIDAAAIPAGEQVVYSVTVGGQTVRYIAYADGRQRYLLPAWGWNWGSTAARVEGNELVLSFLREHIAIQSAVAVQVFSSRGGSSVDNVQSMTIVLPHATPGVRSDFSETADALFDGRPIAESFTTPVLSVYRVWDQIREADPSLSNDDVDGVAIYQNFYTDIVTYAGAYSTGGNPGASGLYENDTVSLFQPRSPALMHMNAIGYGHNGTSRGASRVVLHEIGHRWLLFTSLMEEGQRTRALNPVSAHPAQYVDTRAAFSVYTDTDTSVMGGGFFTDHRNGTFTSGEYGPYGYSWLDLYLMGLAAPEEVPPMFYVGDSAPRLGGEYYAPINQTFSGARRDFTIQQVIDGTGTRTPAYPSTQRLFKVVFVLVADPQRDVTDDEVTLVRQYGGLLAQDFRTATGGRGLVSTAVAPVSGPRRRSVGR